MTAIAKYGSCFFTNTLNTTVVPAVTGIDITFYAALRSAIEPVVGGGYSFTALDAVIAAAVAAGIEPCLKVAISTDEETDVLPANLPAYAAFCAAVATQYDGVVTRYAIENEIDKARLETNWPAADYSALREAAYDAITGVNGDNIVLDAGLTMSAWLSWQAQQYRDASDDQAALDMFARFEASMRRNSKNFPKTVAKLTEWLEKTNNVRAIAIIDDLIATGNVDAIQVHYLQDAWETIGEYCDIIQTAIPGAAMECWECGWGWDDEDTGELSTYSDASHAAGIQKVMLGLAAEGCRVVIQESYVDKPSLDTAVYGRGLVQSDGTFREAATAYEFLTTKLGAATAVAPVVTWAADGVTCYEFTVAGDPVYLATGTYGVVINWGTAPPELMSLTRYNGTVCAACSNNIAVSAYPVFLETL